MPPQVGSPEYGPFALSTDGGDDLWMISAGAPLEGRVTRFNLDAGITYWNLGYTRVVSVAADSQGGAWVTNQYGEGISYFDSENKEHFFDSPEYSDPAPVTVAGDGAAWFGDGSSTMGKKSAGAASFNRLGQKLLGKSRILKVVVALKPSNAGKVSRRLKLRR
jgi:streptogramin lyase